MESPHRRPRQLWQEIRRGERIFSVRDHGPAGHSGTCETKRSPRRREYLSLGYGLLGLRSRRVTVASFAVRVGLIWSGSVASYRRLFRIKFEVDHELEKAGHVRKIYRREDDRPRKLSLLENERSFRALLPLPFWLTFFLLPCRLFSQV
jgi:hypothetical protein